MVSEHKLAYIYGFEQGVTNAENAMPKVDYASKSFSDPYWAGHCAGYARRQCESTLESFRNIDACYALYMKRI